MSDDLEKLLADFDSEETADTESESTDQVTQTAVPNKGFKQLREAYKKLERDHNRLRKEREEYQTRVESFERKERMTTLTGAGLNEKQATAYERIYGPEVTPENLLSFKTDILGLTPTADEQPAPQFAPTAFVEDRSGPSKITKAQFKEMLKVNEPKAMELYKTGRVEF